MATATGKRGVATTRTSAAVVADTNTVWRLRCTLLEEKLEDAQRAHSALREQYGELSLDYRFALDRLWRQNARLPRRDR